MRGDALGRAWNHARIRNQLNFHFEPLAVVAVWTTIADRPPSQRSVVGRNGPKIENVVALEMTATAWFKTALGAPRGDSTLYLLSEGQR
jgi:hypothetical protein